jgi:CDP-glycerol glycerophosphotransferase
MSPRVSVVVPIYNVAAYLDACLQSIAQQTLTDLEVVMVDDGSTDNSPDIARAMAGRDSRFRLVSKPNGGLGSARNAGLDAATGEFLAFVDSDDVLPRHALEALLGSLDRSGSDFASGNVRRLTSYGISPAAFLADVFQRTRTGTHVTKFPALLADRIACNKLFRRSFWDAHSLRFPEGVLYEDMPVTIPAHFLASAVDVVDRTVYLWRTREGADLSITQQRTDLRAFRDRVRAVDSVSRFLADRGLTDEKKAYDASVLREDLRYFLDVLGAATDEFRDTFLDLANDYLDRAAPDVADDLPAIQRLKWLLVRRRAMPELLEVLDFQETELDRRPPLRRGEEWFGDYPFRGDRRLDIPDETYRLAAELAPVTGLRDVAWADDGSLVVRGHAYVELIGAPRRDSQQVLLVVTGPDGDVAELAATAVHRPDVTADASQAVADLDWSGFEVSIPSASLPPANDVPTTVRIGVEVRVGEVRRRTSRLDWPAAQPGRVVTRTARGRPVRARVNPAGELEVSAAVDRAVATTCRWLDGVVQVEGVLHAADREGARLSVRRRVGTAELDYPLHVDAVGDRPAFVGRIPVDDLLGEVDAGDVAGGSEEHGEGVAWDIYVAGRSRRRVTMPADVDEGSWSHRNREITVERSRYGYLSIVDRSPRPVIASATWTGPRELTLTGTAPAGADSLVLSRRRGSEEHVVTVARGHDAAEFTCTIRIRNIEGGVGAWSLIPGRWEITMRRDLDGPDIPVLVDHALLDALPVSTSLGAQAVRFGVSGYDAPLLVVGRDLDDADRGGYHQRLLAERRHSRRLRKAVLFMCSDGTGDGDSPRAIHDELVRRRSSLEQLWVVRDHRFPAPPTATAVRADSAEFYEALARSRYLVSNDYWPEAFERRRGQTALQTWHGTALKLHGEQLSDRSPARRIRRQSAQQRPDNWRLLLSPSPAVTPMLRAAFPYAGEVLETGLPRADLLRRALADGAGERVRARLGIDADRRVLLYAPTYRDHLRQGRTRYRLGATLDVVALQAALGDDWTVLFRRHRYAIGRLPALPVGGVPFVHDVSEHPHTEDLLAAADVLVTDYSSLAVDQVSLGRPVLFFVPDLDSYRDDVRGLAIPLDETAPGPVLRETGEIAAALLDLDAVKREHAAARDAFAASYCALDDGAAAARVVDAVF